MSPDPFSTVGTALGFVSAASGGWKVLQAWIDERGYDEALIEIAVDHVLSASYKGGSSRLAREQLAKDSIVRRAFLKAATKDEFKTSLKQMDVLGSDELTEAEKQLLEYLETIAYGFGASPQERIQRSDFGSIASQLEQLSKVVTTFSTEQEVADEPADATNRLLTDFPLLTPWTERLDYATSFEKQLIAEEKDFAAYGRLIEEARGAPSPDLATEIENIAVLGVEGQPETALERLHDLEDRLPPHDYHRHALFYRLRGTLFLELGRVPDAAKAFNQAQSVLDKVPDAQKERHYRAQLWLERKLAFDKLNTSQWSQDTWQQDYDKARAIDVWHTHPAIDRAVSAFEQVLSKEAFEVSLKSESTFRRSAFLTEALQSFNRALLLAYLCGDAISVQSIRREFAQSLAAHQHNLTDDEVRLFVDELLRTGEAEVIGTFLKAHGERLAPLYDWAKVIERMKPQDPADHDLGPYNWVRSRLVVIEAMSPYLSATMLEALNEEFGKEAVAFLNTLRDGMVRGTSFIQSYFIETFTRIENLKPAQLRRLVDALDGTEIQHRNTFWEVVVAHDWQTSEEPVARMVLEQVEGMTQPHVEFQIADTPAQKFFMGVEVLTQVMGKLGRTFPDLRPQVITWLRQTAAVDENTRDDFYLQLLQLEEQAPGLEIKVWLLETYQRHRDSLEGRLSSENVLAMRSLLLIPYAIQKHPEIFSPDERFDIVKGLVEAAQHAEGEAVKKVDALHVACELVLSLSEDQREEVRAMVFDEGLVQVRRSQALFGFGLDRLAVQANLLRLHAALGVAAGPAGLSFIVQALAEDGHSSTQSTIHLAAEALIKRGEHSDALHVVLYQETFAETKPRVVGTAAQVLVRTLPTPESASHKMIVERLETLMTDATPAVKRALIDQLIKSWTHLPSQVQARFHTRAQILAVEHQNRFIRSWAAELCRIAASEVHV